MSITANDANTGERERLCPERSSEPGGQKKKRTNKEGKKKPTGLALPSITFQFVFIPLVWFPRITINVQARLCASQGLGAPNFQAGAHPLHVLSNTAELGIAAGRAHPHPIVLH